MVSLDNDKNPCYALRVIVWDVFVLFVCPGYLGVSLSLSPI